jgi:hypothetical protein
VSGKRDLTIVPFLVIIVIAFCVFFINQDVYWIIFKGGKPEGLVEWFQFGFYLLAGSIFVVAGSRLVHKEQGLGKWIPLIFGTFILLVALEEISWGQKVFDFTTPEAISTINTQGELTLHNLETVQPFLHLAYIVAGVALSSLPFMRNRKVMTLVKPELSGYLPSLSLIPYFISISIFYFSLDYINPLLGGGVIGNHQEVFETLFSAGIFQWSLSIKGVQRAGNYRQ